MDLTTLAAAQQTLKALIGIAKGATAAAVDHELKAKLIEVQQGILDAQSQLVDAIAERLALLEENAALKQAAREAEAAKVNLASYELVAVDDDGLLLYRSKPDAGHTVPHFACPTCYTGGKVSVLQSWKVSGEQRRYGCGVCSFSLRAAPDPRPKLGYMAV